MWVSEFHQWVKSCFKSSQSTFIFGLPHALKERHLLFFLFAVSLEMIQTVAIHRNTVGPGCSTTTKQAGKHNADAKYADGSMRDFVHRSVHFQKVGVVRLTVNLTN